MKKYAKIITAILLVSLLALTLFACFDPSNDSEGKMTLVILDGENATEYVVDLSKIPSGDSSTGLIAVLDYLQSEGKLTYASNDIGYGPYLTQVGELKESFAESKYLYIYTDVEIDFNVSQYTKHITYKGKTYTDSINNAGDMSIKDGCTIIITYYE